MQIHNSRMQVLERARLSGVPLNARKNMASAAEGSFPQGLKARSFLVTLAARLEAVPFQNFDTSTQDRR
jgi:hypothetical protein